jgi:D-serine deaminase-like pyridoxal phosphate-dependent protein
MKTDCFNTPAVHIDLDTVERNITRTVKDLAAYNIAHRPHMKVHKSVYLAKKQLSMGCRGITCAKLGEAEVMADAGIDDILVAFPLIGTDKLERYRALIEKGATMRTIVNSLEGAKGLSDLGTAMNRRLPILIELDGDIGRGGIQIGRPLEQFVEKAACMPGIFIEGLEYYGGDIYALRNREEIRARSRKEAKDLLEAADVLKKLGQRADIRSAGSSFSVQFAEELNGLTEARAGNSIFNDRARLSLGLISLSDCAMRVIATVVARPDAKHAIMDAGTKTLSSDLVAGQSGFGRIVEAPDVEIFRLNEEHGFLRSESDIRFRVGDVVSIVPNHACVVPNLCEEMYGMRGGALESVIAVDARSKNR